MLKQIDFLPVASLLFVNSIPLYGVLFLGWKIFPILVIYWLENLALLFWNSIKIKKCVSMGSLPKGVSILMNGNDIDLTSRQPLVNFFWMHYGGFTFVSGLILFGFLGYPDYKDIKLLEILIVFSFIFISHGISYYQNFLGRNEFVKTSAITQMFKPYGRVLGMHVVILFGAILVANIDNPSILIFILFISIKTIVDLASYFFEHYFSRNQNLITPVAISQTP